MAVVQILVAYMPTEAARLPRRRVIEATRGRDSYTALIWWLYKANTPEARVKS
jgi:hypothetical protein